MRVLIKLIFPGRFFRFLLEKQKANIQKMNLTTVKSFLAENERTLKKVLTAEEEEQKEVIRKRIVEINAEAHKEQPDNVASTTT